MASGSVVLMRDYLRDYARLVKERSELTEAMIIAAAVNSEKTLERMRKRLDEVNREIRRLESIPITVHDEQEAPTE